MDCNIQCYALVIFVAITATFTASKEPGCLGFDDKGEPRGTTHPPGDIILNYGEPLQIHCILQTNNFTSDSLIFTKNSREIPKEFITKVNSTTIRLDIEKPEPVSDSLYICLVKYDSFSKAICLNKVAVGFPPQPVSNFSCFSKNWDNLYCSWIPPDNHVKTYYRISMYYGPSDRWVKTYCPSNRTENGCLWDKTTTPMYRQPLEEYNFMLKASNVLGNASWKYTIKHFAVVIPNKPLNLTVFNATHNTLSVEWYTPQGLEHFPPGLIYELKYKTSFHDWKEVDTTSLCINKKCKGRRFEVTLTNLYAYTMYDIRLRCRSAKNETPPDLWSNYTAITPTTKPTIPSSPPKTDIGSFEIKQTLSNAIPNRDVFIYWQEIPKNEENGRNFSYKIVNVEENGHKINIKASEVTKWYARFRELSNSTYKFQVSSANSEGLSLASSDILVPNYLLIPPEPEAVTKIPYPNGTYEISWRHPSNRSSIDSYTIFWCENKSDLSHCSGVLSWVKVEKELNVKNITLQAAEGLYQFAVSANTQVASSGMVWASCTISPYAKGEKMKSIWQSGVGPNYVEVSWKLDCSDQIRIITGFRLNYCPISTVSCTDKSCSEIQCKENLTHVEINDSRALKGNVTGLKPYSSYRLFVTVMTKNGLGLDSDTIYFTTIETFPSKISEVNVTQVTNTTISISWNAPSAMNGYLRYYEVYLNDGIKFNVEKKTSYTLSDLKSFSLYNISVSTCTVLCAPASKTISVMTRTGRPSQLERPNVNFVNSSELFVKWSPPFVPSGNVSFYNILLQLFDGSTQIQDYILNSTNLEARIPATECTSKGPNLLYKVAVRAVNVADDNSTIAGPWSQFGEGNCYHSHFPTSVSFIVGISVVGVMSLILLCLFFGWFSRVVWLKCKKMQDVDVKLPARLGTRAIIDKSDNHSMHVWSNQNKDILKESFTPPPDEQLLLERKGKEDMDFFVDEDLVEGMERDSSGCGSGQESVSSVTSGTHMSADSGTEADTRGQVTNIPPKDEGPAYVTLPSSGISATPHHGYVAVSAFTPPTLITKGYIMAAAPSSPPQVSPVIPSFCILDLKQPDIPKPFQSFTNQVMDEIVSPVNST